MLRTLRRLTAPVMGVVLLAALSTTIASADGPNWTTVSNEFQGPIFGLATAPDGSLVVPDAGAGPTEIRKGNTSLIKSHPGITDIAPIGRGNMLALGGGEVEGGLYRISKGHTELIADIPAFEAENDPDEDGVESNPFDLARLNGHRTLVADAAGNSILTVDNKGNVDWVAVLPEQFVATQWLKDLVCPTEDPEIAFVCELPEMVPADPVATTVAVGPDGAYYVGELTGFPGTPGTSRVWRIESGSLHVRCGTDPGCTQVDIDPFTSIIDINFGPDGTMYVVELDEASWLLAEEGLGVGGTVNACTASGGSWDCSEVATGLPFPTAVAISGDSIYVTLFGAIPGQAEVALLN